MFGRPRITIDSVVNDLDNEDSFFRNALGTDVGIAGPPCGSHSLKPIYGNPSQLPQTQLTSSSNVSLLVYKPDTKFSSVKM
jgi:hypothetical protein